MIIKENVILAPYTTFRIGGPARYFCEVKTIEEVKNALRFSRENNLRFFILGGGSNILISDKGFDGLVIKMEINGLEFNGELLSVGAGENWDYVVEEAVKRNLGGIENLSLIPGTVGGAVCQNIGAYGAELKDVLTSVKAYDARTGDIVELSNKECGFEYRSSIFKNNKNLIVFEAELLLLKSSKPNLSYSDLQKLFSSTQPTISEIRQAVIDIRQAKLPYPPNIMPQILKNKGHLPNAGSFFKNPVVSESVFENLILKYPDLKWFNSNSGSVKLSAAQLIEKCGWKGKKYGGVGVSDKHSLVLVNYGNGMVEELIKLAGEIKESVKKEFGIDLESEVEMVA